MGLGKGKFNLFFLKLPDRYIGVDCIIFIVYIYVLIFLLSI